MASPITEKLTQKVEIKLDGKTWPLVLGTNELIECEKLTGLNMLTGEVNITKPSMAFVRAAVYVCLARCKARHEVDGKMKPYTLDEIGSLIHPGNLETVSLGVITAYMASKPEDEPEAVEGEEEDPTKAGT